MSSTSLDILDGKASDDEEMPDALDDLNDFVSNLDVISTKRKATEE
jgi:U3 small nucleolar RNA-associated protein 14